SAVAPLLRGPDEPVRGSERLAHRVNTAPPRCAHRVWDRARPSLPSTRAKRTGRWRPFGSSRPKWRGPPRAAFVAASGRRCREPRSKAVLVRARRAMRWVRSNAPGFDRAALGGARPGVRKKRTPTHNSLSTDSLGSVRWRLANQKGERRTRERDADRLRATDSRQGSARRLRGPLAPDSALRSLRNGRLDHPDGTGTKW